MKFEDRPIAFVAMRFEDEHWRDKKYQVMQEELEAVGYKVLRGDQVQTSGPVVNEVCSLLKKADLVVIDTSGDSHNVSYELGFCHGIDRDPAHTLLLRDNSNIPFNYQHYRHRVYRNVRHLRRLLHDYLDVSEPLSDDMYGYAFTFEFSENALEGYIMDGAECIIDSLLEARLTGRCECFSDEQFMIPGRFFTVGIGVRMRGRKKTPDLGFWKNIIARVNEMTSRFEGRITFKPQMSELSEKRAMKRLIACGSAELREGHITKITSHSGEGRNFFDSYLQRKESESA